MGVIVHHYALYRIQYEAPHLAELSLPLRLVNSLSHWIEPFFTQALPIPFFRGIGHAALHATALLVLAVSSRLDWPKIDRDFVLLALLASFPSVITPQLRIVGLQSCFWLVVLAGIVVPRFRVAFAAGLVGTVASFVLSIAATKENFRTAHFDAKRQVVSADTYYPNGYYQKKRDLLLRMLGRAPDSTRAASSSRP
jgi:hypothetical protein